MRVAIIGAGAMGCLFGAKLAKAGNDVLLVDHDSRTVSAVRKNGVKVKEGKLIWKVQIPIRNVVGDLSSYELVLVMVKAYGTRLVARQLRGKIGKRTMVLTLQNGLGNVDALSESIGERVLAGSTTEASLRLKPGVVVHTGEGLTTLGELDGSKSQRVRDAVRLLKSAGFVSLVTDHVMSVIWSKAVLNSAINPVSALTRLLNGLLVQSAELKELMLDVLEEGAKVAKADGISINAKYLTSLLSKVLRSTSQNQSSMLQDVLNGRRTEVRELNGIIDTIGRRHGVSTPLNAQLLGLISGLEASYL